MKIYGINPVLEALRARRITEIRVSQRAHADDNARLAQVVEPAAPTEDAKPLPKCKDRDDQKFLELAHAARADWLVSKDRAVLKLAKRIARDFGFQIAQPAPFVTAVSASLSAAGEPAPA